MTRYLLLAGLVLTANVAAPLVGVVAGFAALAQSAYIVLDAITPAVSDE
jgi:hypothetical protein